ncbi:MAG: GIY-YIG nuclease family protein [Candidatus Paceibacterota bacterium]|nr:GIY-YIG nuclease family protein [Candidatus Paceibacterota bacterium]
MIYFIKSTKNKKLYTGHIHNLKLRFELHQK